MPRATLTTILGLPLLLAGVHAGASVVATPPIATLATGSATISSSGTVFTPDASNIGFVPAASNYKTIHVNGGTLTVQGVYPFISGPSPLFAFPNTQVGTIFDFGNNSVVNVQGGFLGSNGVGVVLYGGGTLNLTGGFLTNVEAHPGAVVNISGGYINTAPFGASVEPFQSNSGLVVDGGTTNITGGHVALLHTNYGGVLNIANGEISQSAVALGVTIAKVGPFSLSGSSVTNIAGGTFNYDTGFHLFQNATLDLFGNFPGYKTSQIIPAGQMGTITGMLASGSPFSQNFDTTGGGKIEFNVGTFALPIIPVPEPTSAALLGVPIAAAAGLGKRRRGAVMPIN